MKYDNFSYFIESYNAGEMNMSDKKEFENKLNSDRSLQNEVKLRKITDEIVAKQDILSLRYKLSEIENRRKAKRHYLPAKAPRFIKYAAAVVVGLMFITSIGLYLGRNITGDEIVKSYYKTYEPPSAQRSATSVTNDVFSQAIELYNTHEYGKAATLFSKIVESNPSDMQSEFLSGLSNLEDKKYVSAKRSFNNVIADNNSYFIEAAQWYLARCYIETNEKQKAVQLLKTIEKEGNIYSKTARKIVRRYE